MALRAARRLLVRLALLAVVGFVVLQLVPHDGRPGNPPVVAEAPWPTAASAELARRACYDCHSNETRWPTYARIAPVSWLIGRDVAAGRDELNFSHWGRDGSEADDAAEEVAEGAMPPRRYRLLHPEAELSPDEVRELVAALQAMGEGDG